MNYANLFFVIFTVLAGVLIFGVWSNIHVYAQQSSSSAVDSSVISPEVKAKMCDPSNPALKVVNTTEAHICGIPKTVKPSLAGTPSTSSVSSSVIPRQTAKPTANNLVSAPTSKQHQITTTSNNVATTSAAIAPISNPVIKPLSSTPTIAPQSSQQQQLKPQILSLRTMNNTAALNNTLPIASPALLPDKLLFLGFHGGTPGSTSAGKSSTNTKSHSDHSSHRSSDNSPSTHSSHSSTSHKNAKSHNNLASHSSKASSSSSSSSSSSHSSKASVSSS